MTQRVIVLGDEMPCDCCEQPATVMIRRGEYALVMCDKHWQEMREAYIPLSESVKSSLDDVLRG